MQLAELNIATWKIPETAPEARFFMDNIKRINALAERSPGFVWRLVDENRDAHGRTPLGGPETFVTLSVWESPRDFAHFVWNTVHKRIYERRADWFHALESHHMVMWWVEDGARPDLQEAKSRLDHLNEHGDTDHAFGWTHLPDLAGLKSRNGA